MKFVFYTNNISPHQLPLAHEVAKRVGYENFVYVGDEIAWRGKVVDPGGIKVKVKAEGEDEILETCEVLYVGGIRPIDLMERRAKKGLKTFYYSERWFKPIPLRGIKVKGEGEQWYLPGWMRLLVPGYRRMAKRFVKLVNENGCVKFLPIGPWAKKDFVRLGVKLDKIVDWGYYVEPSHALPAEKSGGLLRLLWCGRLLGLKRVGDIVRAVGEHVGLKREGDSLPKISLTIVGDGPEKMWLMKMAEGLPITFLPSQPANKIREIMRVYDTFVLASNAFEGWGAVVSEALEEGMNVIGTFEAGASAAILPIERLYHAGDIGALAKLLEAEYRGALPKCAIGDWTAAKAAERLFKLI